MGRMVNGLGDTMREQVPTELEVLQELPGEFDWVRQEQSWQARTEAWLGRNWIYVAAGLAGLVLVGLARRR